MKNYSRLILIGLLSLLILGLMVGCNNQSKPTPTIDPADDFKLNDLNGNLVSLGDFYGKKVVLYFWGYMCFECREHLKLVQELYDKKLKDVVILAISDDSEGDLEMVKEHIEAEGYTFRCLHGMTKEIPEKYGIEFSPAVVYIDRKGKVFAKNGGTIDNFCELTKVEDFIDVLDKMP